MGEQTPAGRFRDELACEVVAWVDVRRLSRAELDLYARAVAEAASLARAGTDSSLVVPGGDA